MMLYLELELDLSGLNQQHIWCFNTLSLHEHDPNVGVMNRYNTFSMESQLQSTRFK